MSISIVCRDNDQAVKTYVEGLELDPPVRSTTYEEGRYKENTLTLGEVALQLVQPLDGPGAKSRGGDMARALQQRGEGLYSVAVDVTEPVTYAKGLQAKGVQVERFVPETGKVTAGRPKLATPADDVHFLSDRRFTHGVLWEIGRYRPVLT